METLSITLQLILSLSILVTLHECGHFFPAKWFKTKVEKFYLFFNPYFSLWKKKIGETEYGIGWIPFGGYVKIAGMIDESMDKDQMKQPVQPWEFRAKPAWQRLIIMLGGVIVNFVLGFLIFGLMLWYFGTSYVTNESVIKAGHGIKVEQLGQPLGLQDGDNILSIDDIKLEKFEPGIIAREIILNQPKNLNVLRDGKEEALPIPSNMAEILTKHENKNKLIFSPRIPNTIGVVAKESPAEQGGIKVGDQIISIDGIATPYFNDNAAAVKDKANTEVSLVILRDNNTENIKVTLNENGKMGIAPISGDKIFEIKTQKYSLAEALPKGVSTGINFLGSQLKAFGKMGKGEIKAKDSLGSVISMATMFDSSWDWQRFWHITATLSMILGFMNLLPIPGLDGGYVMFLLWEMITGKKVSDKTMEIATTIGFVLLMALMVFSLGNDVRKLF